MYKITLFILAAVFAVALAGQYYVPRAYYTIDAEGHESARVPLRRLRRSLQPSRYRQPGGGANAEANANANAQAYGGGTATANAAANAVAGAGGGRGGQGQGYGGGNSGWGLPTGGYGASNPKALSSGMTRRQYGPVEGRSVTASTSVVMDASGAGYYDQSASVH